MHFTAVRVMKNQPSTSYFEKDIIVLNIYNPTRLTCFMRFFLLKTGSKMGKYSLNILGKII